MCGERSAGGFEAWTPRKAHVVDKVSAECSGFQIPLLGEKGNGLCSRPPASSLGVYLLIGQDCFVNRVPVAYRHVLVGKVRLEKLEEEPLGSTCSMSGRMSLVL